MAVVMKPCAHCGDMFPSKRSTAKYCSSRCQSASFRALREQTDKPYQIQFPHPSKLKRLQEQESMKTDDKSTEVNISGAYDD